MMLTSVGWIEFDQSCVDIDEGLESAVCRRRFGRSNDLRAQGKHAGRVWEVELLKIVEGHLERRDLCKYCGDPGELCFKLALLNKGEDKINVGHPSLIGLIILF